MATRKIINKTMDPADLQSAAAHEVIAELTELVLELKRRGLKTSSWYGLFDLSGDPESLEVINRGYGYQPLPGTVDDRNFPWFLFWEIVWVVLNAGFSKGQRVLDLGGSSSLFSYYLAAKGLEVTTVDLQENLVRNGDAVAKAMGWRLENHAMDMTRLSFDAEFDHITSICVYEHIPMYARVEINRTIARLLRPGGRFSITFDYRNPSRFARISTPTDVYEQFVKPSGLRVRENEEFFDSGKNYLLNPFFSPRVGLREKLRCIRSGQFLPWEIIRSKSENDYTFGALFQEKD